MELAVVASSLGLGSLASVALYKLVRPRFSVSVNCHFCNNNFKVSKWGVNIVMIILRSPDIR